MPILWNANVMKDGAAYIRVPLKTVDVKIINGVAQLDMVRQDVEALRDVLSVALGDHEEMAELKKLAEDSRVSSEGIGMRVRQHFQNS